MNFFFEADTHLYVTLSPVDTQVLNNFGIDDQLLSTSGIQYRQSIGRRDPPFLWGNGGRNMR